MDIGRAGKLFYQHILPS